MNVWRSRSSSNQPEALSIEYPSHMEQPVKAKVTKKVKPIKKKKVPSTKDVNTSSVPLDSPSMGTKAKKYNHLALQWVHEAREDLAFDMHVLMFDAMYCMFASLG